MAVQDYIVDPDTYVNQLAGKLTAEETEKLKQKTLSGIASIGYDLAPVTGEIRSLQFAQDEAKNLVENVLSPQPDKLKMVAQGAGIGLGILGAIPLVGYGTRLANRGLQKLYETFGSGAKELRKAEEAAAKEAARSQELSVTHAQMFNDDRVFEEFVNSLPQYRQNTHAENIREFQRLSAEQRQLLQNRVNERTRVYNEVIGALPTEPRLEVERKVLALHEEEKKAEQNIVKQFEEAKNKPTKGQLITTTNEPLTFGRGSLKNLGEKQKSVREFIGSESFDIIAASNVAKGTPQQWIGFLSNARQKGVKLEELEDAGLLILNAKGEAIGGDLYNISKTNPKEVITKQEILASLETNPAFGMKIKDYEYPIKDYVINNKLPNLKVLNTEAQKILSERIFQIENIPQRQPIVDLIAELQGVQNNTFNMARSLTASDPKDFIKVSKKLEEIATTLPQNQAQVIKSLSQEYSALAKINEDAAKIGKLVPRPRHANLRPIGGQDYREKVFYYDRAIPENSDLKRIWTVHFNEPNTVTFARYDTRGIDSWGDTKFLFEVQSDPHQSISKGFYKLKNEEIDGIAIKGTSEKMQRSNPNQSKIMGEVVKREREAIINRQQELTNITKERPLSNDEMKELIDNNLKLNEINFKANIRPVSTTSLLGRHYGGDLFNTTAHRYDYFPMGKENTWVKLNLRGVIDEARREGKRYVALAPADFYQLGNNSKFKIEQFYGLGAEKNSLTQHNYVNPKLSPSQQKTFFGGPEGLGKYRKNTAIKEGQDRQKDRWYPGELAGEAVLPKAAKEIVKDLGGKVEAKRVYLTDPTKPYKITRDKKPDMAFKSKMERDTMFDELKSEGGYGKADEIGMNDPSNFVWSIVIDTQGMKKTPGKAYRYGGLVQAKREFFAPLI